MALDIKTVGVIRVFHLKGEFDFSEFDFFERSLGTAVEAGGPITLDLCGLESLDIAGVQAIVEAANKVRGRGCLILHACKGRVREVLKMANVESAPNLHVVDCAQAEH